MSKAAPRPSEIKARDIPNFRRPGRIELFEQTLTDLLKIAVLQSSRNDELERRLQELEDKRG